MKKYSILMFNFNNYEVLREPEELDSECEYIYVTDNENLKSNKWKIIVDHSLDNLSAFDKCWTVRYNLFKYCSTDVCIYMDGSIQIHKSLRKLYDSFIESGADVGLNIHPDRVNLVDEYIAWITQRNYLPANADKALLLFGLFNYDPKKNIGLYQGTMRICKRTELNSRIDTTTFNFLQLLSNNGKIDRLDQTIYSFVINRFFTDLKIFPFSQQVFQSEYAEWNGHGERKPLPYNLNCNDNKGYVLGKLEKLYKIN